MVYQVYQHQLVYASKSHPPLFISCKLRCADYDPRPYLHGQLSKDDMEELCQLRRAWESPELRLSLLLLLLHNGNS